MRSAEMHKCGSYRHLTAEVKCGIKIESTRIRLALALAMAVTNPALATHDYGGLAEYSALTSAV